MKIILQLIVMSLIVSCSVVHRETIEVRKPVVPVVNFPYATKLAMVRQFKQGTTMENMPPGFEDILREYINSERCMQ